MDDWAYSELYDALSMLYTPGTKTSTVYFADLYEDYIREGSKKINPPKLLTERYSLEAMAIMLFRGHYLYEVFDRKIQQYIEADLINYNVRVWREVINPKKYEVLKEPFAVLTLEELEAGFVVCFAPLVLSFLAFAIEWIATLKNLVVLHFTIRTYYGVKILEQTEYMKLAKIRLIDVFVMIRAKSLNTN